MIPFSVVIPAHNEAGTIGRLLAALAEDARPGEMEVVVACNGCDDGTAEVARAAMPGAAVVEIDEASKPAALDAGDAAATRFPRFYVDADVVVSAGALRLCASELVTGTHCAAPVADYDLSGRPWPVAAYYRVWQRLPYFNDERVGGVYGLSEEGRSRFEGFPRLIADDQFVLQTFDRSERRCVREGEFQVQPPRTLRALVRNRTRVYRGNRQLAAAGLDLHAPTGGAGAALIRLSRHPRWWPSVAVYTAVNLVAKGRARRASAGWERDDSSRASGPRRRLRVGYVVSAYPKPSHTFVLREVRELRRQGAEVETFSIHATPPAELLSPLDHEEAATTVNLRPVSASTVAAVHARLALRHPATYSRVLKTALQASPPGLRARLWQAFYFAEAVLLLAAADRRRVRHLHAHLANAAADVAWLACELGRARDGGGWEWSFTMHGPTEFFAVERFNLTRKVEAASAVVCISEFCRSQLMMITPPSNWAKLAVVHCGVDTDSFAPAPGAGRAEPAVLCVGRLTPEKGQHVLLQAVAALVAGGSPVRVTLAGDGPARSELEALADHLGIAARVDFLGAVGQDRLAELFHSADVFCLPSFAEGLPIVLMEAMACGVPVVTTPVAGIPELVRDGESGFLVTPGRVDSLRDALHQLLSDPELRRRLADAGRTTVQKSFSLPNNVARLSEVLEGIQ